MKKNLKTLYVAVCCSVGFLLCVHIVKAQESGGENRHAVINDCRSSDGGFHGTYTDCPAGSQHCEPTSCQN